MHTHAGGGFDTIQTIHSTATGWGSGVEEGRRACVKEGQTGACTYHKGFCSSHLTCRRLQVWQPSLLRRWKRLLRSFGGAMAGAKIRKDWHSSLYSAFCLLAPRHGPRRLLYEQAVVEAQRDAPGTVRLETVGLDPRACQNRTAMYESM